MKKSIALFLSLVLVFSLVACDNANNTQQNTTTQQETDTQDDVNDNDQASQDRPDTWIADREITVLVFQSASDAGEDSMSDDIRDYIKERTGFTMNIQSVSSDSSREALAAGLASGDLPEVISFYLNNSGRPEFPLLLRASNEGMFHDIAPYLRESETYGKYFEEGYLPKDTRENIMMRDDHDGATYLVHMAINRNAADPGNKTIGGLYIRRDIADDLGVEIDSIKTAQEMTQLLQQIRDNGYEDNNGNPVIPLGPSSWGGSDRQWAYRNLVFEGPGAQKFAKLDGQVMHESMTDYAERRVDLVRDWMEQGLIHQEYYTMEEPRAQEGIVNRSFGIIADTHSYRPEIQDLEYIPLGSLERFDGSDHMVMQYKSGYAGWAIPETTENPEEIVRFADWLAGPEGKLLYFYGIEGVDYDMVDGQPVAKDELVELQRENPDQANERGFRGVRAWWGEHLAYTDMDNMADFGERTWGEKNADDDSQTTPQQIIEMYNYDEKYDNKEVIDGLYPRAFLYEFEGDGGDLSQALDDWNEEILKAYYASSQEEAYAIIEQARQRLVDAGIEDFCNFLEEKEAEGETIFY